jgi:hypothetical protein
VTPKLLLIAELQKRGLSGLMTKVMQGYYSSAGSPYPDPEGFLARELAALGHPDLGERVKRGDFKHDR